jgi:hypothetical protein
MRSRKSRFALVAVLALALSVTVGLVSGSFAEAKKKKQKKSGRVTVSKTTPIAIPVKPALTGNDTMTTIPLTVGKKAKGKVVGWDTLTITTSFSSTTTGGLNSITAELTAPNGRTASLNNPMVSTVAGNTTSGPLTETPNSPFNACFPGAGPGGNPCPGGSNEDPEATVGPPYAGTIGNGGLSAFGGVPAKGTWTLKVFDSNTTTPGTLNSVSLSLTLKNAPV